VRLRERKEQVDEEYHRIRSLVIFTPKIVKLNKLRRPE
jgi:hypothetical protein